MADDVVPSLLRFLKGYRSLGTMSVRCRFSSGKPRAWEYRVSHRQYRARTDRSAKTSRPTVLTASSNSSPCTEKRHRALPDAKITAIIFLKLVDMLRLIPDDRFLRPLPYCMNAESTLGDIFDSSIENVPRESGRNLQDVRRNTSPGCIRQQHFWQSYRVQISSSLSPRSSTRRQSGSCSEREKLSETHRHTRTSGADTDVEEDCPGVQRVGDSSCEAGTGIGKSIAYLIPAVLWRKPHANAHRVDKH